MIMWIEFDFKLSMNGFEIYFDAVENIKYINQRSISRQCMEQIKWSLTWEKFTF